MTQGFSRGIVIVAIGRNEGERLKVCLRAALKCARTVVYVDSGSTDGSAEHARGVGCEVMELDPAKPFSAARARNEGFDRAMMLEPDAAFVQFIDGDCELEEGWLERGAAALGERKDAGLARGHLREIRPEASIYNRMCDLEWQKTPGEIAACGGIFLARVEAVRGAGGFRPDVIAGEDDEFCVRVRSRGWKILMVDAPMARHDAAMTRFGQWWRRARRTGHAYAQVAALHGGGVERYFARDRQRILLWGLAVPVAALAFAPLTRGVSLLAMLGLYALQLAYIARGCRKRGWRWADAWPYACFALISRFPALYGLIEYHWRDGCGQPMTIIEHKRSS